MQSSPPQSDGKARALRELSRSLSHSPRGIPSPSPPASESNPTQRFDDTWNNEDLLHSTQHKIDDETNTLPQHHRIRSTAKKINTWQMLRSNQPIPDTSMINGQFMDFDHSLSDDEIVSVEQGRGGNRSNRSTPGKVSSPFQVFDSLYDLTPPSGRSRKSYVAETGSLRRDAQIRRASRNDMDTASPRALSTRKSQATSANNERKRTSLAQLHAKVSEDESSFVEERPPTLTFHSKNTRWGAPRSRQTSLQLDGVFDVSSRIQATPRSRPTTAQNATAQSFVLPDIPNLTELVSGVFQDGTPVFSKNAPSRSRPNAPNGRQPNHIPIDSVPIPDEEKAIFAALQLLQDKVSQMEHEHAEAGKKIEEQELEIIELRAVNQAQDKFRRSDSALGSTDGEGSGKGSWRVEKTRLDATVQTLRTKLDRAERKVDVLDIEKKRLSSERDNMAAQLGVAFQNFEELKVEKEALHAENDTLRQEIDALRVEVESLRDQLERGEEQHREETVQLRRQIDQSGDVSKKENTSLRAELARARAQNDENTQNLTRKDMELRKARKDQAEYAKLKTENESLKAQIATLKVRREEELHRWSNREAELKSKVHRRDETIRHFQDMTQEQTNEAMRLDNENLRQELAQLAAQHEEDSHQWSRKEAELKRKLRKREGAARQMSDMTREILGIRHANDQRINVPAPEAGGDENRFEEPTEQKSNYRREENTRTRIRSRVQEEVRNSRAASASHSHINESPRKSYSKTTRNSQQISLPADISRSVSAPISTKRNIEVESDVESTTDLSLAPRGTPYATRTTISRKSTLPVERPADPELTELSFIDSAQIAQLRRTLEEERAAYRGRASSVPLERAAREGTIRSERPVREDTVRSVASGKSTCQPSLSRKSSLKNVTRTNATQFEEDLTGNVSNVDGGDPEPTQTKQSIVDTSMLSNTSRRRRSAPTEMTSAFIVPDIKLGTRRQDTTKIDIARNIESRLHDNENCIVCRREAADPLADALRVPKLVPVSSRMPDDVDATLRPARSPKEALALVVKELQDERAHLHIELNVMRAHLEHHDVSMGMRKRKEINDAIQEFLRLIEIKDTQIYNLYDVLEGQNDHDLTEQDVEEITKEIRAEEGNVTAGPEKKGKDKKVTIQSYIESEDEHSGEEELPWEGFEDSQSMNLVGLETRRPTVH